MPDFVAALVAAALFCIGLAVLNGLTRVILPPDFAEGGVLQIGGAAILAIMAWRSRVGPRRDAHDDGSEPSRPTAS